ncbi:hypothetical protein b3_0074 [Synechococcus phage B3]|nr:hypothetical protein b3_0074 [Synechococcus phage B3]QGT54688.1 hypothetical protein b23_0073 [Synechococcus phage B23]
MIKQKEFCNATSTGQIWINKNTLEKEEIISVGDRVVTNKYDCHYETFLNDYIIDYLESLKSLRDKIQILNYELNRLRNPIEC